MEGLTLNPVIKKLNEQIKAAQKDAEDISAKAAEEDRSEFTEDEQAAFEAAVSTVKTLSARRDDLQEALQREVKETPQRTPEAWTDPEPKPQQIVGQGAVIEQDPKRGFRSLGEFGAIVASHTMPNGRADERLNIMQAITGMGQDVGSDGGFLVPPEFSVMIWDGLNAAPDNLLGRTDSYPVMGDSLTMNANAETSRAAGSRYGGIRAYWIGEGDQITSSSPTFRQLKLEPQELAVLVYVTKKLLGNAPSLDAYLTRAATEEINFLVSDAIINGTGSGQPLGVLNGGCTVSVAKEQGQGAATVLRENISKMWSRLHPRSRANAVWFINVDVEPQLDSLTLDVGTGGVPVYMPAGGISELPYGRLKGRPVIPIEYCATLGTVGDIILADLGMYASGTAGGIDSAMSMHLRFDYAESVFRFMFAVDGQPWLQSAITPYKGTNTLSPFVTLATRA